MDFDLLPNDQCPGAAAAYRADQIRTNRPNALDKFALLAHSTTNPAQGEAVILYSLGSIGSAPAGQCPLAPVDTSSCENLARRAVRILGPCVACPDGSMPIDVHVGAAPQLAEYFCASDAGSQLFQLTGDSTQCRRERISTDVGGRSLATYSDVARTANADRSLALISGAHGELWWSQDQGLRSMVGVTLSSPPDAVVRGGSKRRVLDAMGTYGVNAADIFYRPDPFLGYVNDPIPWRASQVVATGSITGEPDWALVNGFPLSGAIGVEAVDDGGNTAIIAQSSPAAGNAYQGAIASLTDGTQLLVVFQADRLLIANVTGGLSSPPGSLQGLLTPQSGANVTSLAFAQPTSDGAIGYALTTNGLFQLFIHGGVWSALPLTLPFNGAVRVWSESGRARIGASDGTVYSLPGLLPLTCPIAGGVADFGSACGKTYAVGASGLFGLDMAGDGTASWTREAAFDSLFPGGSPTRVSAPEPGCSATRTSSTSTRSTEPSSRCSAPAIRTITEAHVSVAK